MSTRSNTIIEDLNTHEKIYLYRHCDGYLEGAGFDLLNFIKEPEISNIKNAYELAEKLKNKDLGYEDSEGLHLDIEYIYVLQFSNGELFNAKMFNVKAFKPKLNQDYTEINIGKEITADLLKLYELEKNNKKNLQKNSSDFIELSNAGSLKLEKISIRKNAILSVAKPENGKFGCIVQIEGDKYPVIEKYEDVLNMLYKES